MKGSGPNRSLFPRHGSVPFAAQLQTGIFQLPLGLDAARLLGLVVPRPPLRQQRRLDSYALSGGW